MTELDARRVYSEARLSEFRKQLTAADELVAGKACVYAIGSFGRVEASPHSDLDLFIAGRLDLERKQNGVVRSALRPLNEILVKADLIQATRQLGIPEFSGDGRYVTHYSVEQLVKTMGRPDDDATNTLTARLLLILESRPILGADSYNEIIGDVITANWRDYEDHRDSFMPAFLVNDVLRLWRTFCVNYEARTEREPDEAKAKGKLFNYKLRHSRLLTCYSAVMHLLSVYVTNRTVSPLDAIAMTRLTPTERIEGLVAHGGVSAAHDALEEVLARYTTFLEHTNKPESDQIAQFKDKQFSLARSSEARLFGDAMFQALQALGGDSPLFRLIVV